MESKNEMTRKQFLVLTFSLVGTTAAMGSSCSDDNNNVTGTGGTSSGGTAGTTGTAGGGGTTGTGGGGGTSAAACADPLPETQSAADHTHTVTIAASTLDATTAQTFTTSTVLAHMHMVTLEPSDLTTLKGGGTVTVTSSVASAHSHMYTISCH